MICRHGSYEQKGRTLTGRFRTLPDNTPEPKPEPSRPSMGHYSVLAANVLPDNVLGAAKTAPDDALAELPSLASSGFGFPLPCRFRPALIDSLFLPACVLFVCSQLAFFFAGFGTFDFVILLFLFCPHVPNNIPPCLPF